MMNLSIYKISFASLSSCSKPMSYRLIGDVHYLNDYIYIYIYHAHSFQSVFSGQGNLVACIVTVVK